MFLEQFYAIAFLVISVSHIVQARMWVEFFAMLRKTGYAALIILACRQGAARGWFATRLAAVGRTAFSNYLFSTLAGTLLFYGFAGGLYAELSRFETWLFVPPLWLAMLIWSKAWLDRFQYGPLEWVWRSLSRWERQPMHKLAPAGE